jgi:hypothetical protein
MRQVLLYVAGLALLVGCSDHNGLPTDQAAGNPAEKPSFAGAEVERSNVALFIFDPAVGLLVTIGFAEGVTLADLCAGIPVDLSPNTVANVVIPPSEAFLAAAHGQDVPVLVYEFADDPCDGVGETLLASGTVLFHFTDLHPHNGAAIQNIGLRGTLDLVAGGQALLTLVGTVFNQAPDGTIKANTGTIRLTPI